MTKSAYPRDLVGYGRNPPDPRWPGGARIAVQFVLNYEEGGENCILHGDAASEAFLSEITGAQPLQGVRHMNMESIYEYGSRAGFWRLWRLFGERGMPLTVYGVAMALARNPEAVAAMEEAGWEIASHGLTLDRLPVHGPRGGAPADRGGDPPAHRGHGRAAARLVHGPQQPQHAPARRRGRRVSLLRRLPMPTTCPTG